MRIRILPPAIEDIASARVFYGQREEGLGEYFMDSIFAEIDSLILYGGIHSMKLGYYRLITKRFPYGIYYQIEDDTAVVYRILDCHRNPVWIAQQLTSNPK